MVRQYEEIKFKLMNKEDINFDDEFFRQRREGRTGNEEPDEATKQEIRHNYHAMFNTKFLKKKYAEHLKEANEFQSKYPIDVY